MHTLLKELVDCGIEPILRKDISGEYFWDLQSGMKSHMHLYLNEEGGFTHKIKLRYNEEEYVEYLGDVKWVARKAMQGRNYANYAWHKLLGNV
jgi:hypothetical protein